MQKVIDVSRVSQPMHAPSGWENERSIEHFPERLGSDYITVSARIFCIKTVVKRKLEGLTVEHFQ